MTIQEAVDIINQMVRDTGKPLSEAVRESWPLLGEFSEEDTKTLIQEALAARANPQLRSVSTRSITVSMPNQVVERREITCQVLKDFVYHVNGAAKCVASFTRYDVHTHLTQLRQLQAGVNRHVSVWEYMHERMVKLKKDRVDDLAEGEQAKIARMLYETKTAKLPLELA